MRFAPLPLPSWLRRVTCGGIAIAALLGLSFTVAAEVGRKTNPHVLAWVPFETKLPSRAVLAARRAFHAQGLQVEKGPVAKVIHGQFREGEIRKDFKDCYSTWWLVPVAADPKNAELFGGILEHPFDKNDKGRFYYLKTRQKPVTEIFTKAIETANTTLRKIKRRPRMINLGAGVTSETLVAASLGFDVLHVDVNPESTATVAPSAGPVLNRIEFHIDRIEHLPVRPRPFGISAFEFAYLGNVSNYIVDAYFPRVWRWILEKLPPGGVFAGHFIGPDNPWTRGQLSYDWSGSHFTDRELDELFRPYDLLERSKLPRKTTVGGYDMGDVTEIVAVKK